VEEHDDWVFFFNAGPYADPLRNNPRYQALVRKMNLEP
jgi:hypothetical protein